MVQLHPEPPAAVAVNPPASESTTVTVLEVAELPMLDTLIVNVAPA